ncbi:hypothetical protein ACHAWF_014104 [Thalassiosira exigua]
MLERIVRLTLLLPLALAASSSGAGALRGSGRVADLRPFGECDDSFPLAASPRSSDGSMRLRRLAAAGSGRHLVPVPPRKGERSEYYESGEYYAPLCPDGRRVGVRELSRCSGGACWDEDLQQCTWECTCAFGTVTPPPTPRSTAVQFRVTEHPVLVHLRRLASGYVINAGVRQTIIKFVEEQLTVALEDLGFGVQLIEVTSPGRLPGMRHAVPLSVKVRAPEDIADFAHSFILEALADYGVRIASRLGSFDGAMDGVSLSFETYDFNDILAGYALVQDEVSEHPVLLHLRRLPQGYRLNRKVQESVVSYIERKLQAIMEEMGFGIEVIEVTYQGRLPGMPHALPLNVKVQAPSDVSSGFVRSIILEALGDSNIDIATELLKIDGIYGVAPGNFAVAFDSYNLDDLLLDGEDDPLEVVNRGPGPAKAPLVYEEAPQKTPGKWEEHEDDIKQHGPSGYWDAAEKGEKPNHWGAVEKDAKPKKFVDNATVADSRRVRPSQRPPVEAGDHRSDKRKKKGNSKRSHSQDSSTPDGSESGDKKPSDDVPVLDHVDIVTTISELPTGLDPPEDRGASRVSYNPKSQTRSNRVEPEGDKIERKKSMFEDKALMSTVRSEREEARKRRAPRSRKAGMGEMLKQSFKFGNRPEDPTMSDETNARQIEPEEVPTKRAPRKSRHNNCRSSFGDVLKQSFTQEFGRYPELPTSQPEGPMADDLDEERANAPPKRKSPKKKGSSARLKSSGHGDKRKKRSTRKPKEEEASSESLASKVDDPSILTMEPPAKAEDRGADRREREGARRKRVSKKRGSMGDRLKQSFKLGLYSEQPKEEEKSRAGLAQAFLLSSPLGKLLRRESVKYSARQPTSSLKLAELLHFFTRAPFNIQADDASNTAMAPPPAVGASPGVGGYDDQPFLLLAATDRPGAGVDAGGGAVGGGGGARVRDPIQTTCPHTGSVVTASHPLRAPSASHRGGTFGVRALVPVPLANMTGRGGDDANSALFVGHGGSTGRGQRGGKDDHLFLLSRSVSGASASGGGGEKNPVWKVRPPEPLSSTRQSLAVSPCGRYLAAAAHSGNCYLWEWTSGDDNLVKVWKAHHRPVTCVLFDDHDGGTLFTAGEDGVVNAWCTIDLVDVDGPESVHPFRTWSEHHLPITSLCTLLGGGAGSTRLVSSSLDRNLIIMELGGSASSSGRNADEGGARTLARMCMPSGIHAVVTDSSAGRLYAGGADGTVYCVDLCRHAIQETLDGAGTAVDANQSGGDPFFIQNGNMSSSKQADFESILSGRHVSSATAPAGPSSDQSRYVSELKGHGKAVTSLALLDPSDLISSSVDVSTAPLLASGSDDGTLRIWDLRSRSCVRVVRPWSSEGAGAATSSAPPVTAVVAVPKSDSGGRAPTSTSASDARSTKRGSAQEDPATWFRPPRRFVRGTSSLEGGGSAAAAGGCRPMLRPRRGESYLKFWEDEHNDEVPPRKRVRKSARTRARTSAPRREEAECRDGASDKVEIARLRKALEESEAVVERWKAVNNQLMVKLKKQQTR